MKLVIVESPAKAKTINKYLGAEYTVLASFGHVRDLREKDGAVEPDREFAMHWEVGERARKPVSEIVKALKGADTLILATDPDREGEAISWHLKEVLDEAKKLGKIDVKRVVFNEITKTAILEAMRHPRDLDRDLVDAYLARRALDYLVGFNLSPVLWRKLPGSRSAGRVQSVALRLICERETEIERFRAREYWTIASTFKAPDGTAFDAKLTHLDGVRLDKFDLPNEDAARAAVAKIEAGDPFRVGSVEKKRSRRNPMAPFTTSTLQQEASRKLGFGASRTMRLAQQLYEGVDIGGETVGLITYMRTDSVTLSQEAVRAARALIAEQYGKRFLPDQPRVWKTQAKNAQEAHEAIRPTDLLRRPDQVRSRLSDDQLKLYELIWRRTVASEMESAQLDQTAVDLVSRDGRTTLRATGSVIVFEGFLALYREDRDDPSGEEDEENRLLPALAEGDATPRQSVKPEQHFTQPPPRFSEASLVKRLEELGIGRPSTYASILETLQDRGYVRLDKRRFIPEDRGRVVTTFLEQYFRRYVEYDFTAKLEDLLDEISGGRAEWRKVLTDFWAAFSKSLDETKDLKIRDVIDALDAALGPHFFPEKPGGADPRSCPACSDGRLGLRLGKRGAFIGCSRYPECSFTRPLSVEGADGEGGALGGVANKVLGVDPATGEEVHLKNGPYGPYLQLGTGGAKEKPKRVSIPKDIQPSDVGLELALKLLSLPRPVGDHPTDGLPILAGLGRFGPYLKHGDKYKSIPTTQDALEIGLNRAVDILAQPSTGRRFGRAAGPVGRVVGNHPDDGQPITAAAGRYGPYVKHGSTYANLPKDGSPDSVTLDEAVALLAERRAREAAGGGKPKRAAAAKKKIATPKAAKPPAEAKPKAAPKAKKAKKAAPAGDID
ncbi:MAG: type I DNA topoisomerase [Azospirillum sp.]|nr:type I DNA topoisomerase [Azospirillum sp.]